MRPHEAVVVEVWGKRAAVVLKALREGVGPGGEMLHAGPHRQVLALNVEIGDALSGVLQRVEFIPERGLDRQGMGLKGPWPSGRPVLRAAPEVVYIPDDRLGVTISRVPSYDEPEAVGV